MSGSPERYADEAARVAHERLSEVVHAYLMCGAGAGVSAAEAEAAWSAYRFLPRVLMDVTDVDVSTTLLGTPVRSPWGIAPTTLQRAVHPEGEVAMARGAAAAGSVLVVSSNAGSPFDAIAGTGVAWWLQIYVTEDRAATIPVVERALDAGARALVLTADTPVVGRKRGPAAGIWDAIDPSWVRANVEASGDGATDDGASGGGAAGGRKAMDLGPQDVAWLAERFEVPVAVKGVLHPADARRCVDAGAAAVWVSNHGGRQLDRAVPSALALGEVASAVGASAEVYVDGGLRGGADGLAAAALGARAVFLGRPALQALAAGGAAGVNRLLGELSEELLEALQLSGVSDWGGVPPDLLRARR